MATVIAGPALRDLKLIRRRRRRDVARPLVVGMVAALISGLAAIHFLLRYLRSNSLTVFVVYRLVLAAVVVVVFLGR